MNIFTKVLVLGSGGREYEIVRLLSKCIRVLQIFVAPGNGGTAKMGERVKNVPVVADNIDAIIQFCLENGVTLVVPGPEEPSSDLREFVIDCCSGIGALIVCRPKDLVIHKIPARAALVFSGLPVSFFGRTITDNDSYIFIGPEATAICFKHVRWFDAWSRAHD